MQKIKNPIDRIRNRRQVNDEMPWLELQQEYDKFGEQRLAPTPTRGSVPRREFMRYANAGKMEYPNILSAVRRGIQRHKRKLMIAGGVIGGIAIAGGIIGGTLAATAKKRRKEMQHESSAVGVFERLSDSSGVDGFGGSGGGGGGGGGSGGYGNYQ